ncbi:MAG: bifunctional diaminohydroxyphosphoribosylaminopyrimidine deaminase/5-amino-6-(5-phosphoribosylamino)uracil reductase RibD [Bacteroidia bacterium]
MLVSSCKENKLLSYFGSVNEQEKYIQRCLQLAANGLGNVAPNPMVGCVVVLDDKIIGEGFHANYGDAHAEVNAINSVKNKALLKDATLYVSLEPCSHHGKTPPCSDLIIESGIKKVVIGCSDTNPLVAGKGVEKLKRAGVEVIIGIMEKEARKLNKRFFTFYEQKRPYIILKWAQTADGFIDRKRKDNTEPALQISNEHSRRLLHKWRSEEQAIMVGTNTARLDNPRLDVRLVSGKNPLRMVLDKNLELTENLNLFDGSQSTLVFTSRKKDAKNTTTYISIDFEKDVLLQVMSVLHEKQIQSVIVEGGSKLLQSFIDEDFWDEARVFISDTFIPNGVAGPKLNAEPVSVDNIDSNKLYYFKK